MVQMDESTGDLLMELEEVAAKLLFFPSLPSRVGCVMSTELAAAGGDVEAAALAYGGG